MAPAPVRLLGVVPAAASGADWSSSAARAPVNEESAARSSAAMEKSVDDLIFVLRRGRREATEKAKRAEQTESRTSRRSRSRRRRRIRRRAAFERARRHSSKCLYENGSKKVSGCFFWTFVFVFRSFLSTSSPPFFSSSSSPPLLSPPPDKLATHTARGNRLVSITQREPKKQREKRTSPTKNQSGDGLCGRGG